MPDTSTPLARALRVDLTSGTCELETIPPEVLRRYPGGCALGARYLYDEVPPSAGWASSANRLFMFGGPLTASSIAGSGGYSVSTKGALTEGATSTQAQGVFGAYLRSCGLWGLIVQGASADWQYVVISPDGSATFRDARHLVGKDTWETEDAIAADLGLPEESLSIACIGPAGENLARFASIMSDRGHAAAHNGVGAVMGSKRLKAVVVVRGTYASPIADRAALARISRAFNETVRGRVGGVHFYGTLNGVQNNYATGNLPVKNYQTSRWDIPEEKFARFSGQYMHEHFEPRRHRPCWACSNKHCQMMTITEGPYAGMTVEEPEYEQLSAFSANLGIDDVSSAMMLANVVDRVGLDTNEAGWVLGLAMECFQRGIIGNGDSGKVDAGGLDLSWGNAAAAAELLWRIARREGLGDVLAEGVMRAVERIGRGAPEVGVYTRKGSTPRGHDHRARWTEMFDTSVSESGGLDNTLMVADITQFGLPAKIDPFDPDALARAEAKMKGSMQFEDSLVTCRFNTQCNVQGLADAVAAATGWDFTFDEAMACGRRAVNLMRAFNVRAGLTADLDRPSPRYGSKAPDGPAAGKAIGEHFEQMVREYYALMGWDERGWPLEGTLRELQLESVAADLGMPR